MKGDAMKNEALSRDGLQQLADLALLPDNEIDTVDIPEASQDSWSQARRRSKDAVPTEPVTLRVDTDILEWFRANSGDGSYRLEMSRVLRAHIATSGK